MAVDFRIIDAADFVFMWTEDGKVMVQFWSPSHGDVSLSMEPGEAYLLELLLSGMEVEVEWR